MTEMFVKSYNTDKENLTDMLDTLNFWLPAKDVKITGGKLTGDTAVLDVEGVLASGVKALTLVRLIRGPSGLFDRATMAGMLPSAKSHLALPTFLIDLPATAFLHKGDGARAVLGLDR